jgi:hypothetical protein
LYDRLLAASASNQSAPKSKTAFGYAGLTTLPADFASFPASNRIGPNHRVCGKDRKVISSFVTVPATLDLASMRKSSPLEGVDLQSSIRSGSSGEVLKEIRFLSSMRSCKPVRTVDVHF